MRGSTAHFCKCSRRLAPFFSLSRPLNGTGAYHLRNSPVLVVLDQFLLFFITHMSTSPKCGAPSEEIYAVRCDLVQNPISIFAVGGPTATVGSVKPLDHNLHPCTCSRWANV